MNRLDVIRGMTAEELAEFLVEHVAQSPWCKPEAELDPETLECKLWDCRKCCEEWLRAEGAP